MRIEAIEIERLAIELDPPFHAAWDPEPRRRFEASIVRVRTDEGLTGIGSGDTMDGFSAYAHLFVGSDPLRIARHARALETVSFHAGRYWPLEAALWDLYGKAAGQPVWRLLGGARERLPAYASLGELRAPERRAQDALALAQEGFCALKVRIARDRAQEGVEVVAAIRAALGDRMQIIVDLNQWWRMPGDIRRPLDVAGARRLIERLAEHDVLWVEEPLGGGDLEGMATLRAAGHARIAGGEMARSFQELHSALARDALDVYQPDVVLALGISGARTLAELALRRGRWFTPHTWTNGIGVLANLHVCCGVGGGPLIELPHDPPAWTASRRDFMLARPLEIDADGMLGAGEEPGLGIELDEEAIAAHLVSREVLRG